MGNEWLVISSSAICCPVADSNIGVTKPYTFEPDMESHEKIGNAACASSPTSWYVWKKNTESRRPRKLEFVFLEKNGGLH